MASIERRSELRGALQISDVHVSVIRTGDIEIRDEGGFEAVIVRIDTDAGIVGIGEAASSPHAVRAAVDAPFYWAASRAIRELLVGRDPFEIGLLWEQIYRFTSSPGRRGVYIHALSAIDMALWDILGKALGLPIYKLLGGAFQRRIPAYASFVMPASPEEVRELAARTVDAGWPALKMGWFPHEESREADRAIVRAAREGAGPDARLMLDVGLRWDVGRPALRLWDAKTAIQRIRDWQEFDLFWVEEPLPPDDVDGYGRLTAAVETHIAAGEQESTRFPLYELMDRGGIDVLQFDIARVGGLTESRRLVQAAHDRNKPYAPHCFTTGITLAASAHLAAASPNAVYLEYMMSDTALAQSLVHPRLEPVEGYVSVPEAPGLGVELDHELIDRLSV